MKSTSNMLVVGAMCACAGASAIAQSTVQVYGQMRTSMNRIETGGSDYFEVRDNATRIGFKGAEDLGDGLKALFGLEMGVDSDTGALTSPAFRHSYVGLASPTWGTFAIGRLDVGSAGGSPIYNQLSKIVSFAANDAGATAIGTSIVNSRNRVSNAIGYMSPTYAGFNVRARMNLRGTEAQGEDAAKSYDLGLNYANGGLSLAAGVSKDTRDGGLRTNEFDSKWQFGASYDFGGIETYGLYGVDRYQGTSTSRRKVDYWVVGARYYAGPHQLVFNVMQRDVQGSLTAERKRQQIAYMYALSKRTELQLFFDNDGVNSAVPGSRIRALGAGIRHAF